MNLRSVTVKRYGAGPMDEPNTVTYCLDHRDVRRIESLPCGGVEIQFRAGHAYTYPRQDIIERRHHV